MEKIAEFIHRIDNLIWGPWMLFLLLGTGVYLTLRMKFLPLKNLKYALLCTIGREGNAKTRENKSISSFSALTTELAATIGTGNIVGVATAMVLGGPGALLWMMLSSMVGMATKLTESTLAVKYRSVNDKGEFVGGPMYILKKAFPNQKTGGFLGVLFAVFAVMVSFGMGNMTQSNSIADALYVAFSIPRAKTGLVVSIITILVVLGGIQSISKVTQVMVPFMGIFYMLGTILVIVTHLGNIPGGIWQIITMAFCPEAVTGGLMGNLSVSIQEALRFGVSRGVFSNEAGLGAGGISAASAHTDDYVKQGYISMTSIFIDTIVICSVTGLAISASGVLGTLDEQGELLTGTALTIAVFETTFGKWGAVFLSICITLFAFATLIGWAYQGEKAFEFLAGKSSYCIWYRFCYGLVALIGSLCSLEIVWEFSDICNGLMAVPNLIGVLALSGEACREIRKRDIRILVEERDKT